MTAAAVDPRIHLVLASASPRRAELLAQLQVAFEVCPADIDESRKAAELAADYVNRLAREKAAAGLAGAGRGQTPGLTPLILGADTIVVLGDEILGKPCGQTEGEQMLQRLSGRTHQVYTAVCVMTADYQQACTVSTSVTFRELEAGEAAWYWQTGEPADKAGGYGIQGIGGIFVEEIKGSYSAVVGLPLVETRQLLQSVILKVCGFDIFREQLYG